MQRASRRTYANPPTHAVSEIMRNQVMTAKDPLTSDAYPGNQAALRRLSLTAPSIQRKLAVGAVNDPLEAEADRVADRVMRMPAPGLKGAADPARVLRRSGASEEEEKKKLQMKSAGQAGSRASSTAQILRRDPAPTEPAKAAAPATAQGAPKEDATLSSPDASGGSITVTVPWDEYILKTLPLIGSQAPKLQMPELKLPGVYCPPPLSLGPQQPPSTGQYTLPPSASPSQQPSFLPPPVTSPGLGANQSGSFTLDPSNPSGAATSPSAPSRLALYNSGLWSLGLRLGFPDVNAEAAPGAAPSAAQQASQAAEINAFHVNGRVPSFYQLDKGKLVGIIWSIISTYEPGIARKVAQAMSGKSQGGGLSYQADALITPDFKGVGVSFTITFGGAKAPATTSAPPVQYKAAPGAGGIMPEAPEGVHEALRDPGEPLNASAREFFEPRFGADFSQVRIHDDTRAAATARDVNALAYAVGNHIVLGPEAGKSPSRLLAHELAHVVQQNAAPAIDQAPGADAREPMTPNRGQAAVRASGRTVGTLIQRDNPPQQQPACTEQPTFTSSTRPPIDILADTIEEFVNKMNSALGGNSHMTPTMKWNLQVSASGIVEKVNLTLDTNVIRPRWAGGRPNDAHKRLIQQAEGLIKDHEGRHVEIAKQGAREAVCAALGKKENDADKLLTEYECVTIPTRQENLDVKEGELKIVYNPPGTATDVILTGVATHPNYKCTP